MRITTANVLTLAGAIVAAAAAVAMTIGLKFELPTEVLTVVVYKGMFAAAAGLMIFGALLGRRAHSRQQELKNRAETASIEEGSFRENANGPQSESLRAENVGPFERAGRERPEP
jgi:uncharacterized membrane protein